jgi:hypothetical protein
MHHPQSFIRLISNPFKYRLFLLKNLPAAYFSGVRVVSVTEDSCSVKIPYKWFSRNPFRSTYFACLSMAAEMSTGILAMMQVYKRQPAVALLVVKVSSEYVKKATGKTVFTCNAGAAFKQAVEASIATGESRTVTARSTGVNESGETVAEFEITWSFKARGANTKS